VSLVSLTGAFWCLGMRIALEGDFSSSMAALGAYRGKIGTVRGVK
jgi:hypothetical protein